MKDVNFVKNLIEHNESIVLFLSSHKDNPEYKATLDRFNEKIFKVSDTGITYRTINSWENANLLLAGPNEEAKWRKFSIIEVLWLHIIKELRDLGLSTSKILTLKDSLFKNNGAYGEGITSTFGVYLLSIRAKRDVMVVVANSGIGDFLLDFEYELALRNEDFPNTHIVINLNKICADFEGKPEYRKRNQHFYIYNQKEMEIINAINSSPDIKEIVIKPLNGKIHKVDYKSHIKNPEKALDLIKNLISSSSRNEIVVKTEQNRVVLVEVVNKN